MIDSLGIREFGTSSKGNGVFLYKDGSIGLGFKLPGVKNYSMTMEERFSAYESLKNIISNLQLLYKGEGCLYQFISQPNYDISRIEDLSLKMNFIDKEANLAKNGIFWKGLIDKNIKDTFNAYRNFGRLTRDNYIFIRIYINFGKSKTSAFDIIKQLLVLKPNEEKNQTALDKMEISIEEHLSKFKTLNREPLPLLDMINVLRKYFGFSTLKNLPCLSTGDSPLFHLFPGKVVLEEGYIKTSEKVDITEEKKNKNKIDDEKLFQAVDKNQRKFEEIISFKNSAEYKELEEEINLLFLNVLQYDRSVLDTYSLKEKLAIVYSVINDLLKIDNLKNLVSNNRFLTFESLKIIKREKEFLVNSNIENNDTYLKVFSLKEVPSTLNIFHGQSLNSLYGDYTITLNFKILDNTEAQTKMRRQIVMENIKLGMPIMKWFIPIEAVQEKVAALDRTIRTLDRSDWSRVEASVFLTLRGNSIKDEREQNIGEYETITRCKWQHEMHSRPFFILTNAMPGAYNKVGNSISRRNLLLNSTNVAQLSPMVGEEKGSKNPVRPFLGEESVINFNLNEAKAGHLAIQGGTGGGKSFFGNKLLLAYLTNGDKVITTEKGDSFTRTTLFFGGKVYKPDMTGKIKINPFVIPEAAWSDDRYKKETYVQMIATLSQMCDNYDRSIQQDYFKLLKSCFEDNNGRPNRNNVINGAVTPTKILSVMRTFWQNQHEAEKQSFAKFTNQGIFGVLFDGNEGLDMDYPLINIDYSQLNDDKIKDFVFKSLLQNIFLEMSKSSGKTFFNINDEFWDAIKSSSSSENANNTAIAQVETFFRVARKLGGKIAVISQAISDIRESPLRTAVLNNIYHSFFTNTTTHKELQQIQRLFQLQSHQLDQISKLSQVKGSYSEYFAIAPYGEKQGGISVERKLTTKFKYFPTPLETRLFTTDPQEKRIFRRIYEEFGASGDTSNVSQEIVMKAVRLFMDVIPKGISEIYFQEKLIGNKNDFIITFKQLVEQKYGSFKSAKDKVQWSDFINLSENLPSRKKFTY